MTKDVLLNPLKLLLIGDVGTGKTSILSRLIKDEFNPTYKPTNGLTCENYNVDGVLLVYDISNPASFENMTYWLDIITQFGNPKAIVKLVGNKNDLDRAISMKSVEQFAAKWGVSFIEISALELSSNIKMTFHQICIEINSTPENADDRLFSTCGFISNRMIDTQLQNLSCNDTQPFQVVLIDLNLAADCEIRCVEKSLDDPDLKYVALSYRWGELPETMVDTKVGYSAVITSFDLMNFYDFCKMILLETDLKYMDYVWVDAICVDQINQDKRKATIYQMSNIYEKAKYILAVPDLHMKHLQNTLRSSKDIIDGSNFYQLYLYELIHGNIDQLALMDEEYLSFYGVPHDPELRQLLNTSTDQFRDGFMKCGTNATVNVDEGILEHILRNIPIKEQLRGSDLTAFHLDDDKQGLERLHHCHQSKCPLDPDHIMCTEMHCTIKTAKNHKWKQEIQETSTDIRRSMDFMADLIKDWSTRVWVISEYNIAKKKNNLKFWFIQLGEFNQDITFFKFDLMDSTFYTTIKKNLGNFYNTFYYDMKDPVYLTFHDTMSSQLNQQTFFEMMLKSKASKNEDRFYAIFPLTPYKNTILDKAEVSKWKIDTLTSVKIKLFQLLHTKDKLNLLFLSCNTDAMFLGEILPTFATSLIDWNYSIADYFSLKEVSRYNFDIDSSDAITFYPSDLPYINLTPKEYYIVEAEDVVQSNPDIWNSLPFEDPYESNHIVGIYNWSMEKDDDYAYSIYLQGSFKDNIWIIITSDSVRRSNGYIRHTIHDYSTGFNVY